MAIANTYQAFTKCHVLGQVTHSVLTKSLQVVCFCYPYFRRSSKLEPVVAVAPLCDERTGTILGGSLWILEATYSLFKHVALTQVWVVHKGLSEAQGRRGLCKSRLPWELLNHLRHDTAGGENLGDFRAKPYSLLEINVLLSRNSISLLLGLSRNLMFKHRESTGYDSAIWAAYRELGLF